jgi:hypothetical protein
MVADFLFLYKGKLIYYFEIIKRFEKDTGYIN